MGRIAFPISDTQGNTTAAEAFVEIQDVGGVTTISGTNTFTEHTTVGEGETLRFDPTVSTTLVMQNVNLIIEGRLEMHPADPSVFHTVRFTGINESGVVGGGLVPLTTDPGLWVMHEGKLDLVGSPKAGWNRIGDDPSWLASDELIQTPTAVGNISGFVPHTLGALPTAVNDVGSLYELPGYEGMFASEIDALFRTKDGQLRAEVLNLTRNVVIEGTPTGRAHVFIHGHTTQIIKHALFRYLGPRKNGEKIAGRWPLHFHHAHDLSRGSLMEGLVARNVGSHAFVTHRSHGVTWRDCIAYDVQAMPYWWDDRMGNTEEETHDVLYEHCVAAKIARGTPMDGANGFALFGGNGDKIKGCVAVGGDHANDTDGGFFWPAANNEGLWEVAEDCVAHNNKHCGIFSWPTSAIPHHVERFICYRNSLGIRHGAYRNEFIYTNCVNANNSRADTLFHASSKDAPHIQKWIECRLGKAVVDNGIQPSATPVEVIDCDCTSLAVAIKGSIAKLVDFMRLTLDGRDIAPSDVTWEQSPEGTRLRFKRLDGSCWQSQMTSSGPQVTDPISDFE